MMSRVEKREEGREEGGEEGGFREEGRTKERIEWGDWEF
jgi:hypothetical protein